LKSLQRFQSEQIKTAAKRPVTKEGGREEEKSRLGIASGNLREPDDFAAAKTLERSQSCLLWRWTFDGTVRFPRAPAACGKSL
jgi:hypothetical protein